MVNKVTEGLVLRGGRIVTHTKVMEKSFIVIKGEKIDAIQGEKQKDSLDFDYPILQLEEEDLILPGFIDIHIHGAEGSDVMDGSLEALEVISRALPKEGTTSYLATTITERPKVIDQVIEKVVAFKNNQFLGAEVLGINLEGPFINGEMAGAQCREKISKPSIAIMEKWLRLAKGNIKLVTLAPEVEEGLRLVKFLIEKGIIVSIGHSKASLEVTKEAIKEGLSHATHMFNAMPPLHHREPGPLGALLLDERIRAEVIFDGIHVVEEMVALAIKVKGFEKIQLITDSIRAKGLEDGNYELGGQRVIVRDKEARLKDGTLAGSLLKMNEAVKRAYKIVGGNLSALIRLSSLNAAEELGIANRKGSITPGKDADIVVLDKDFNVRLTLCRGRICYSSL